MIMLGLYVTGKIPFKTVYLHGLILDEHGQKMSKSKGNVIDPLTVVDKYGSDAMRMGILSGQTAGNNQPFDPSKVIGARNFCNKLWNVARYIEDKADGRAGKPTPQSDADHWILSRLGKAAGDIAKHLDNYRLSEAYDTLYHFVWDDFADWYIEASKAEENRPLLAYTLESILKLAHPFAPFVTETIWQTLEWAPDEVLATATWPEVPAADTKRAKAFEEVKTIVSEARAITKAIGVTGTTLVYSKAPVVEANTELIKRLARLGEVSYGTDQDGVRLTRTKYDLRLGISKEDARKYREKLDEQQKEIQKQIKNLEARLSNKSYVDNAPEAVVNQTREQLENAQTREQTIKEEKTRF
jgi:valyl-tRNA synthetase